MIPILPAACTLAAFIRFALPELSIGAWSELNTSLSARISLLHFELSSGGISSAEAGNCFAIILQDFFKELPEFAIPEKYGTSFIRRPSKTLSEVRHLKNKLRRKAFTNTSTPDDRSNFFDALHAYNILRNDQKKNDIRRSTARDEKHFRSNFWDFSKKLSTGTLHGDQPRPSFLQSTADDHFASRYGSFSPLDLSKLNWIPHPHSQETSSPFNLDPIRPVDVRRILQRKSSNSAPGPDGLCYGMLKKLHCTHHFMATLFSKILVGGIPQSSWTLSKIVLLHKQGYTSIPGNFRMIALSSVVGKIYHQILAERFEHYVRNNKLIDCRFQKAFVQGISGCTDHNVIVHEIIRHAKSNSRTAHISWFDLEDAFGSVQHDLIFLMLARLNVPEAIQHYIKNLYSSLSGRAVTKDWTSKEFGFKKGIFQGDPLSPLIFILCFDPIVQFLNQKFILWL